MSRRTTCKIINNIRRLRFDHDQMTQQQLVKQAGCMRQTIIALESGKYTPSLVLAFRIARTFNCKVDDIFTFEQTGSDKG